MPRGKATSAIARHLWRDHNRTKSEGTHTQRLLLHEELHATSVEGELAHAHGPDGSYLTRCPGCGHEHTCTELDLSGE